MARGLVGGMLRLGLAGGLAATALTLAAPPAAADWLGDQRRVAAGPGVQESPALSGSKLVYSDSRNERTVGDPADPVTLGDVRVKDLATGEDRILTPEHSADGRPAISGDRVLWHDYGDGATTGGLWYHNLATGSHRRLPVADGIDPQVDGTRACYERADRIYVYDFSAARERAVSPSGGNAGSCDISGRVVVWQDQRAEPGFDIYAYDLATGRETRLTTDPADQLAPRIDGHRVVWHDQRGGTPNTDIYSYDLRTGKESRVTGADGVQWYPDVSGERVVWTDQRAGDQNSEVYLYDLASGVETRVSNQSGWSGNAVISGDRIVYQDNHSGGDDLYLRRITPPTVTVSVPFSVVAGHSGTVTGAVTDADGRPVAAETVRLEYAPTGATWLPGEVTTTSLGGTFSISTPVLSGPARVRVRFLGTPEFPAATSDVLGVAVVAREPRGALVR